MSEKKVWLPKYLEGYTAEMFLHIKRFLGYKTNRTVLIDLISEQYGRLKEDLMKHIEKEHLDLAYVLVCFTKTAPSQVKILLGGISFRNHL